MSNVPADLRYTKDHEWIRVAADGTAVIGITDHAQAALGDVTFVDLPKVGASFGHGDVFGTVESVKAASDVYSPVSGTVLKANAALADKPETVNEDAYGEGWLFVLQPDNQDEYKGLLDADAYQASIE